MNKPRKDAYAFPLPKTSATKQQPRNVLRALRYQETVTRAANGEGKFVRSVKGRGGVYGHVLLTIEPNERRKGIELTADSLAGAIPKAFLQSAMKGVREGLANGVVEGHPVDDVRVRIIGGSSHETDSSELAFKMAGIFAVKDALKKAGPVVLK